MPTKQHKILIVDDEPNILITLRFLLEQAGHAVVEANNGKEALTVAIREQPHIAILDVMMPELDGFKLAAKIREDPALADVRIVFLTARGQAKDLSEGYRSGGEVYLTKPFDNQQLITTINELITYG
ncbi:MAG: response regulator [Bacteroidota bacterium]